MNAAHGKTHTKQTNMNKKQNEKEPLRLGTTPFSYADQASCSITTLPS